MIICPRCKAENNYDTAYCFGCGLILANVKKSIKVKNHGIYPSELKIDEYALSVDLSLSEAVKDIPIVSRAANLLIEYWSKPINRTNLLGNAVRVGPNQISSIYEIVKELSEQLGVEVPETYIKYDPTYNAMTLGTNKDHLIIIHSALIDNFTREELKFVLGHELGHIKSEHVTYNTIAYLCAVGFSGFVSAVFKPLLLAIEAWQRRAEITADRAGLLACCNPIASVQALTMFALGSRKLLEEFNLQEFLLQEREIDRLYDILNKAISGTNHPYTVVRVREMIDFCCSETGQTLLNRMKTRRRHEGYFSSSKKELSLIRAETTFNTNKIAATSSRFCSARLYHIFLIC